MDEIVIPGKADPQFQQVVAQFGGPAFLRRAQRAENALADLMSRLTRTRSEWLTMVRLRLGQVHALAGGWHRLEALFSAECLAALKGLYNELAPRLQVPLAATDNDTTLCAALDDLRASMARFNERWRAHLAQTNLTEVNQRREEYNRWYVFEKECAVGSVRIARQGFQPLEMLTRDDLARWLADLPAIVPLE